MACVFSISLLTVSTYPTSLMPFQCGWYPKRMYEKDFEVPVYDFHRETFGHQNNVEKAIRKKGMIFVLSMHHSYWNYYLDAYKYDAKDPKYSGLYAEPHEAGTPPSRQFIDYWYSTTTEVIDKYAPDIIYFDGPGLNDIPTIDKTRMIAHYYNKANERNQDVVLVYKKEFFPEGSGLKDYESKYPGSTTDHFWITDLSITNWFPCKTASYITGQLAIHSLIDIVSKNGCLMLNVPPDHDGRINDRAKKILTEIGDWLEINGEAIYYTRPWKIFGEGPTKPDLLLKKVRYRDVKYTKEDIRFTRSKDGKSIYAIILGWPQSGQVSIEALNEESKNIKSLSMLGHEGMLDWEETENGIRIKLPYDNPCKHAYTIKIVLKQV